MAYYSPYARRTRTPNREDRDMGSLMDESPASPVMNECEYRTRFSKTKVVIEEDVQVVGLGFSIDCVGNNVDEEYERRRDDIEVVGALSAQPCSSANVRGGRIHEQMDYYGRGRQPEVDDMPLYEVEPDLIISSVGSLKDSANDNSSNRPAAPERAKHCCWNCEGDHMIGDCKEPRDPKMITKNRKVFMAAKAKRGGGGGGSGNYNDFGSGGGNGGRNRRYHEEVNPMRKGKPGELSPEIRFAMELNPDEVPLHVYRMRVYGYPPGWMESAMEEANSGLKLYGDDVITMSNGSRRREPKINPDNIIAYPGFNAPMPFGEKDYWKEYGYPRYNMDDSIPNMLRKLNSKNLVHEGDGIVSQSFATSKDRPSTAAPTWEQFNSLTGLDRPAINDGAKNGIGRGRYIEPSPRNQSSLRGTSTLPRPRVDRFEDTPRRLPQIRNLEPQDVDERYLPIQQKGKGQKRQRRNSRCSSPSLLRDGEIYEDSMVLQPSSTITNATATRNRSTDSPVILDLPPTPSPAKQTAKCGSDADDETGSGTGNSSDFNTRLDSSPPPSKRRRTNNEKSLLAPLLKTKKSRTKPKTVVDTKCDSDDEVTILTNNSSDSGLSDKNSVSTRKNEDMDKSYDSDCLVIDTDNEPSPTKIKSKASNSPKSQNKSADVSPTKSVCSIASNARDSGTGSVFTPSRVIAELEIESDGEDWGRGNSMPAATQKPISSPGSSTADEGMLDLGSDHGSDSDKDVSTHVITKPSIISTFDENWEDSSNGSDKLVIAEEPIVPEESDGSNSTAANEEIQENSNKEFIPSNPRIEAIKEVFLANSEDELKSDENNSSFSSLPSFDKFAQGMPEMVFEEDLPERTGRLDRVLQALKTRKSGESSSSKKY